MCCIDLDRRDPVYPPAVERTMIAVNSQSFGPKVDGYSKPMRFPILFELRETTLNKALQICIVHFSTEHPSPSLALPPLPPRNVTGEFASTVVLVLY